MQNDSDQPLGCRRGNPNGPHSSQPKAERSWVPIVVGAIGLVLAGWATYWVGSNSWNGLVSPGWEQAQGTVHQAGLEQSGLKYGPRVVYRYDVDGHAYENDRISFPEIRSSGSTEIQLRQLTAKYSVGGPCTVYYNPASPATSCLEPGINYVLLVVGVPFSLGLLAIAAGTIRYGLRELRHGPVPITTYISRPAHPPGD